MAESIFEPGSGTGRPMGPACSRLLVIGLVALLSWLPSAFGQDLRAVDGAMARQDYQTARTMLEQTRSGNEQNAEWLWRMARLEYELGAALKEGSPGAVEHYKKGLELARQALALNDNSGHAHAWYARLRGKLALSQDTEAKIRASSEVKDHTLKAMQLTPKDDSNYHAMGRWHYELAQLSWVERKLASVLFTTPPRGSLDEAVKYFRRAIALNPRDIQHHLWLARTLLKLGKKGEAKSTLDQALQLPVRGATDRRHRDEAKHLLEEM